MDGDYAGEAIETEAGDPGDRSLIDDLRLLAGDAKSLTRAEIAYQKSRARALGGGLGKIAALGALGLLLLCLALVALVVGLLLALAPILTAWGATAAVTGGLILLALAAALWARASWRGLTDLIDDKGPHE
ncbi:MAG: phage holin family protein [Novosphingobium sp.]